MSTQSDDERRHNKRRNEDKELIKQAVKEAVKERIDETYRTFGKWSMRFIAISFAAAIAYFILWANGWHSIANHVR